MAIRMTLLRISHTSYATGFLGSSSALNRARLLLLSKKRKGKWRKEK